MTSFELLFALFGLLLGLAIAEVLGGFVRVIKLRRKVRIGWLTPLLGILVILDQTTLWMVAYDLRDALPVTYLTLVVVLAMVGGYYLISTLIVPDDPAEHPDFDAHYYSHNRVVLFGVAAINLVLVGATLLLASPAMWGRENNLGHAEILALERGTTGVGGLVAVAELLLLALLIAVKGKRANLFLLLLLIGLNLGNALITAL